MTQAEQTVGLVHDVLGPDVVGAYSLGSATLGGLRACSDIDVFVVSRRRTTARERRTLVEGLLEISGSGREVRSARPVELTIVVGSDVRPWRYPPRCEFQYGEWLRDEFERGDTPSPTPSPDLAPLITMVLLGNNPLFGPPPAEVLDPVPRRDLIRAMTAAVPELLAEIESDTRNVILTLARIWATLATGEIRSKDAAADWVLDHIPPEHLPVLTRARAIYLGNAEERWGDLRTRVRPCADHFAGAIERLAAPVPHDGHHEQTS